MNDTKKKIYKTGIVGLGRIASLMEKDTYAKRYYRYLSHAGTFTKHPHFKLICASDINPARLGAFGRKWRVGRLYRDYKAMVAENDIDLLIIATPPDTHAGIIKASAGKVRLILCEKPLAKGLQEVEGLVGLCKAEGTKLAVNLIRRYDPSHRKLRNYMRMGKLGRIRRVSCVYGKGIFNSGSHLIDILIYLFGDIRYVQSLFCIKQRYHEITPDIFMLFKNNVPCLIQAVDYDDYRIFEIDIFGTKGRVTVGDDGLKIVHYMRSRHHSEKGAFELCKTRQIIKPTVSEAFYHMAENMFKVLSNNTKPLCSGEDYLQLEHVLEAVLESVAKQGEKIYLRKDM